MRKFFTTYLIALLLGCTAPEEPTATLFSDVTKDSGIQFENNLEYTERLNPYTYRNFFNGAGVAIGDINNDGFADIYMAGNQVNNKLYLNNGDFTFSDIAKQAGVACEGVWSTGVTMVDINADGWLDIYVCKSGDPDTPNRHNELFINNKDLTFTERSAEYGLDVKGLSVHAAFFDYDKDGDLDCYLLTNSIRSVGNYDLVEGQRNIPDPGGNKFFVNENGKFIDRTVESGIYTSNIGFGLGITLADFNHDSWVDIFVSNDFFERDYLYINDQDGGFNESLTSYFSSISMGSMGADVADLDNDGRPELFVTEMLPDSLSRKKTKTVYENWDKFNLNIKTGYHHQFPRNVLQRNIGDSLYAEVGRLAEVASTEWSWGALLFDMNNDGLRDIFVANGIYKDLLDRDYLTYQATDENIRQMIRNKEDVISRLVETMPSSPRKNYAYKNLGQLKFENVTDEWGFSAPSYSNGSAYGDLDNDGDLDLVLNNINSPSRIYKNNTDSTNHSLQLLLKSMTKNRFAVGALIDVYAGDHYFYADNFTTRGFQSSVDNRVIVGLGHEINRIDSIHITWPSGNVTTHTQLALDRLNVIEEPEMGGQGRIAKSNPVDLKLQLVATPFAHHGNGLVDFNRNRLLPFMYSNEQPDITPINNESLLYVGGGKGQLGGIMKVDGGNFSYQEIQHDYAIAEETKSIFFDADNDGDQDLYLASGGRFFPKSSSAYKDKLLLNQGDFTFVEGEPMPFDHYASTSCVVPLDYDKDGDLDLFVGERFDPFNYGEGGRAYLFENNGNGRFTDITKNTAKEFTNVQMITDAVSVDYNGDGWHDIVVIGDWMAVQFYKNEKGVFVKDSVIPVEKGWYNRIETADLNNDNIPDFIIGNHGMNSFFKESDRMYVADFDQNGSVEQIFCTKVGDKYYPVIDKDDLLSQLPGLKKQLVYYEEYARKSIDELFDQAILEKSTVFEVDKLRSFMILSDSEGFQIVDLPKEAQYAPVYAIEIHDLDKDGVPDLFLGGNQYNVKPQFGRYDASAGWFFKGVKDKNEVDFAKGIPLGITGEIRSLKVMEDGGKTYIFTAKYNDDLEIYEVIR